MTGRLMVYAQSLGEENTACDTRPHRHCTPEHREQTVCGSLWEAGFVVSEGWDDPWFPREDVIVLLE